MPRGGVDAAGAAFGRDVIGEDDRRGAIDEGMAGLQAFQSRPFKAGATAGECDRLAFGAPLPRLSKVPAGAGVGAFSIACNTGCLRSLATRSRSPCQSNRM